MLRNKLTTSMKDDKFDHILTHLNNSSAHTASNTLARQQMPVKPPIFHGRDNLVQEISHLTCEDHTSRACIFGPGGIGETSLALAVVQSSVVQSKYAPSHRFWVPCIETASTCLFLQLLYINLRIGRDTKNTLEDILSELNSPKAPRLIFLDNFETPWNMLDGTRKEVSNSLVNSTMLRFWWRCAERNLHARIKSKNLHPVDKEASLSIFHELYPKSKDDPDVDRLLGVLGFMPFAVTLMAKLGRKSRSSAKDLLKDWSQDGTGMISRSNSPEENMNRSIGFSVDSALVKRNPDALLLLVALSLLLAGTCRKNLDWWAPDLKSTSRHSDAHGYSSPFDKRREWVCGIYDPLRSACCSILHGRHQSNCRGGPSASAGSMLSECLWPCLSLSRCGVQAALGSACSRGYQHPVSARNRTYAIKQPHFLEINWGS